MSKSTDTKTARVAALLQRPSGASLKAICDLTGWQPHSARAALSTLRKAGLQIERVPPDSGGPDGSNADGSRSSLYRIFADSVIPA